MRYRFERYDLSSGNKIIESIYHREVSKYQTTFSILSSWGDIGERYSHAGKECDCYVRKGKSLLWVCSFLIGEGMTDFNWEYLSDCGFREDLANVGIKYSSKAEIEKTSLNIFKSAREEAISKLKSKSNLY